VAKLIVNDIEKWGSCNTTAKENMGKPGACQKEPRCVLNTS